MTQSSDEPLDREIVGEKLRDYFGTQYNADPPELEGDAKRYVAFLATRLSIALELLDYVLTQFIKLYNVEDLVELRKLTRDEWTGDIG